MLLEFRGAVRVRFIDLGKGEIIQAESWESENRKGSRTFKRQTETERERKEATEMVEEAIIREAEGTAGENGDLDARNRESFNKREGSTVTNAKARILSQPLTGRE